LNKLSNVLDELPFWSAPFGIKLLDYIDYKPNITAIDIGFGNGFPLTELAMRLGDKSTVYGIDPWKGGIERVKKKIKAYGLSNIKLIEGVAESVPLEDKSVDLIASNNGINNVGDMEKVFSECARISKKEAQFVQTMNLDTTMFEFYSKLEEILSELKLAKEIELMKKHISQKRPPLNYVLSLYSKYGFEIKDMVHDQFTYKFADGTAMLNHFFIRVGFMGEWIKFLPQEKVHEIFNLVETKLNQRTLYPGQIRLSIPYVLINAIKI
ncbi:MAG: class I SAM-dependent methyltransferase, partial [Bacteroidales bacterium]|nr:class I SAM-dependent methyltransferase [Bacteroidales bacterium]